jgi:hypothetical protein
LSTITFVDVDQNPACVSKLFYVLMVEPSGKSCMGIDTIPTLQIVLELHPDSIA